MTATIEQSTVIPTSTVVPTSTVIPTSTVDLRTRPLAQQGEVNGVAYECVGEGLPVTLFAHGLGSSRAETRPLAAGTAGTRILLDFRGHGQSEDLVQSWDYQILADDLASVAEATGATQAVGVSMGSGAVLRLATQQPERFERLAFVMPASISEVRADPAVRRLYDIAALVEAGNDEDIVDLMLAELPPAVRTQRGARILLTRHAREISRRILPYPAEGAKPLDDQDLAQRITCPSLVLGQEGDTIHPLSVARALDQLLPRSNFVALPPGGVFWTAHKRARQLIADHLAGFYSA